MSLERFVATIAGDLDAPIESRLETCRNWYLEQLRRNALERWLRDGAGLRVELIRGALGELPVVVNDGARLEGYLFSPSVHYFDFMAREAKKIPGFEPAVFRGGLSLVSPFVRSAGLDRVAMVNNWGLSTSPELSKAVTAPGLADLRKDVTSRLPDHAILFSGVDGRDTGVLDSFRADGWLLVPYRPVFVRSVATLSAMRRTIRRQTGYDLRSLARSGVTLRLARALTDIEALGIERLYSGLYLKKHRSPNPMYTNVFFSETVGGGFQEVILAELSGRIVGFVSFSRERSRLTCRLVGYDLSLDRTKFPVYRGLFAAVVCLAESLRVDAFLSTGAAKFKAHRGAQEHLEFQAVYVDHLAFLRRVPWRFSSSLFGLAASRLDSSKL